jgi:hypothetical protein
MILLEVIVPILPTILVIGIVGLRMRMIVSIGAGEILLPSAPSSLTIREAIVVV